MADQQQNESEKPKRHYTPRTPKVDSVIKAIQGGEYDDNIFEIRDAVQDRVKIKQDAVLELVHEIFGEEAQIVTPREGPSLTRVRVEDVGTDQAPMPQSPEFEVTSASGDVITTPVGRRMLSTGFETSQPVRPNPFFEKIKAKHQPPVEATDHSQAEVERLAEEMDGDGENLDSELDEVERRMESEGAQVPPIERRGAAISGLHSSEIGE